MKLARPILAAVTVGLVLAVVFTVFAVELASGQTRTRNQIKTELQDRAQLTAALMNSLFGALERADPSDTAWFGGQVINTQELEAAGAEAASYALVANSEGRVLQASAGFRSGPGLSVPASALSRVVTAFKAELAHPNPNAPAPYYIGDLHPNGTGYAADLVVPFLAADGGVRLLVTGLDPTTPLFIHFFGGNIRTVPGVPGEINYYVDGNGRVIAASAKGIQPGAMPSHVSIASLTRLSGDEHGYYFQQAQLDQSSWRVLLVAPDRTLFSSVNGAREYVPWIIFAALVAMALLAGILAWRVIRTAETVSEVNAKLATVNEDLRLANESLHRRAAELARSNEELESFASIASHDLQEPLRKVRTFTEQLTVLEAERLSEKGQDYLARANSAAERMQKLIEDLLKFSRVSTQGRPFQTVDLGEITNRVLVDLENQIQDAGAVVDVGPLPVIAADPLQMQQLMQNLISNAIKFRRPDVTPEVKVRSEVADGKARLTVADNGIGFEPRYSARIFRIFERLHGRTEYPGTGIGLALCRKITDRHGGTIEAEGVPGQGATFTIVLPVSQPDGSLGFGAASPRGEEIGAGVGV
jgi:signal transduction histidine kinase